MNKIKHMYPARKYTWEDRDVQHYFMAKAAQVRRTYLPRMYFLMIFLSGTLVGFVTNRPSTSSRDPLEQLQKNISAILSDSIFIAAHAGVKVVSLENGQVFYEHDSKALMNPASNVKLITSAAALSVLDTNFQFKTSVFIDKSASGSETVQNMYLKGYGDPDLTTSDLDSLAYAIRRLGINRIVNNIIVDDSFFDDQYWGSSWSWDDESDPDAPFINALSINKNCIGINIAADSKDISISLEPNTGFVSVFNKATVVLDSIHMPLKIRRFPLANVNTIMIEGDIFRYGRITQKIPLSRPEFYAGTLFKESLLRAGVSVSGDIVSGVVPDGILEIARHVQPIQKVVETMNKQSDNLSAENLLKVMGATKNGIPGSAKNGVFIENKFLSSLGMDTTQFSLADGSGVSRHNLLSADQLIQLLVALNKQPRLFMLFYNSLPVAGMDGTIAGRMIEYPAAYNLHAKTGTLNGVTCLSGYVQTRDGEMLAFAIMMQNFVSPASKYRQAQDKIGSLLAGFSRIMNTDNIQKP
jgi:serine-type D-Ala-D-Ala carboxypeptidase/endopeptidase (penicillin-binding protein 4)